MASEVIGPTFRRVILAITCAAVGGGSAVATGALGKDETPRRDATLYPRLSIVETDTHVLKSDVQTLKDRSAGIDRRLERIEDKLDRLIERK